MGIVGAQFGGPVLFAQWLSRRFEIALRTESVCAHDRVLRSEPFAVGSVSMTITSSVPAYMDLPGVFEAGLRASDVAVLVLSRAEGLLRLNADPIRQVSRWGGPTVAVVNDPYCDGAGHESAPPGWLRLVPTSEVTAALPRDWLVHSTGGRSSPIGCVVSTERRLCSPRFFGWGAQARPGELRGSERATIKEER